MASVAQRSALREFIQFCWRQTQQTGRLTLAFEALYLEMGGLVIPLYTSFVLVQLGQIGADRSGSQAVMLAAPMAIATGLVLLFLLSRRYLEPRLQASLAADTVTLRREMLHRYQNSGRLQQVEPETFDDEVEQFGRLGQLVGQDAVMVTAQAMALLIIIPIEAVLTGPIVLVSLCMALITLNYVLNEGDGYRRTQWQMAEEVIETTARRRLWTRYVRPVAGRYDNERMMRGLFSLLDRDLKIYRLNQREERQLFNVLNLITGVERIVIMTVAAVGIITGLFDVSQFVLILFLAGRMQIPLRGILQTWLTTARPVQGMQVMQRLMKRGDVEAAGSPTPAAEPEDGALVSPSTGRPVQWHQHLAAQRSLSSLGLSAEAVAVFTGEAATIQATLIDNITLGLEEQQPLALSLLSWSGLQPWVTSLPDGFLTLLDEDSLMLPNYVNQLLSALRVLLLNAGGHVVIDDRAGLMEPELTSGLINILERWPQRPEVTILSNDPSWGRLTAAEPVA